MNKAFLPGVRIGKAMIVSVCAWETACELLKQVGISGPENDFPEINFGFFCTIPDGLPRPWLRDQHVLRGVLPEGPPQPVRLRHDQGGGGGHDQGAGRRPRLRGGQGQLRPAWHRGDAVVVVRIASVPKFFFRVRICQLKKSRILNLFKKRSVVLWDVFEETIRAKFRDI